MLKGMEAPFYQSWTEINVIQIHKFYIKIFPKIETILKNESIFHVDLLKIIGWLILLKIQRNLILKRERNLT